MASGLVIHVSSGENKHTEILSDERIRIGRGDDCNLRLRASDLPRPPESPGPVLELVRTNGFYRVSAYDQAIEITHNGEPLKPDAEIMDGDEVRFHPSDLLLQFFPIRSLPAVVGFPPHETQVAPFIEAAAIESAATARRDDAKVFLREFTRELVREINISTKLITLAIAVALVGGILYIGFALFKEIQTNRRAAESQRAQLEKMKEQAAETNKHLADISKSNQEIRDSLSLAEKLRSEYGSGVCLISGAFYYVESGTGRPLRWPESQLNESGEVVPGSVEQAPLTPEGKGAIAEFPFLGTGFYVGNGFVVTNRHIAQPWQADDRAESLGKSVKGQARLKKLTAYFPNHPQPFVLKVKQAAQRDDLSVCTLDVKDVPNDIPVLPLENDSASVAVGNSVVMMGYPSGLDRLLALLEDSESRGLQQRYSSADSQLAYLAETRRIQPLTTQGSITDLPERDVRRIVYDARTAEGGSGSPLFGPSGRVIGINFAVFTENQASNFAVPIRYGIALLERSGWQPPVEREGQSETSGAGQTTTRPTAPAPK
jgi:S1-C subfamily serine protease